MNMNTKATWTETMKIAVLSLIVTSALLGMQHSWNGAPPAAMSEKAPGDRSPLQPQTGDAKASEHEGERTLADMNTRPEEIRAQMAQLRQEQAPPAAPEQKAAADPLTQQEAEERAESQLRAQEATIEEMVRREPVDPAWAPTAVASITDVFHSKEVKNLHLVDVQCRTTLCRIEVAADEAGAEGTPFNQSFRKFLLHAPWQSEGFGHIAPPDNSSPTAVFFLAREGYPLPEPPL